MTPAQRYLRRLIDYVARCYEMTSSDMLCFTKSPPETYEARRILYRVANKTLGLSTCQIADVIGDSHAGVKYHLTQAEKQMKTSIVFASVVAKVTAHATREFRALDIMAAEAAE